MQFFFTLREKENCIAAFAAPSPHTPIFADEIIALCLFQFCIFPLMAGIVLRNQSQTRPSHGKGFSAHQFYFPGQAL